MLQFTCPVGQVLGTIYLSCMQNHLSRTSINVLPWVYVITGGNGVQVQLKIFPVSSARYIPKLSFPDIFRVNTGVCIIHECAVYMEEYSNNNIHMYADICQLYM